MSTELVIKALEVTCDTPTDKAILSHLAFRANSKGICWPKMATLAKAAGVTRRTVCTSIRRLEDRGWITVNRSNHYNVYDVKLGSHLVTTRCEAGITSDVKLGSPPIERSLKDHVEPNELGSITRKGKTMKYSRGEGRSMSEILERFDNERVRDLEDHIRQYAGRPAKPMVLSSFWREGCHIMFDDVTQASLTAKQAGFMKAITKHSKDSGIDVFDRLIAVLSDWQGFVEYTTDRDGCKEKPKRPNLGYMAGHLESLLNYTPGASVDESDDDLLKHAKY